MRKGDFVLLIVAVLIWVLYIPLNFVRQPLHDLKTPIDNLIPLIPVFIIPYVSYYFYIIFTAFSLNSKKNPLKLRKFLFAWILILLVSYFIYFVFQSYTQRPSIASTDILSKFLAFWYSMDKPYNAFPSTHTSLSVLALLTWAKSKSKIKGVMILWAILIIISTLLVKQHYVADIFGGTILGITIFYLTKKVL